MAQAGWSGRLALFAGGVVFGVLVMEIGLRVVGISYPDFFTEDRVLGRAPLPHAEGWWTIEGRSYVRINSDGMRDREHAIEKPENTLRIAVLGDSFTAAFEVPIEQAFWAVMKERLADCPSLAGRELETLNFGVGGYGTASQYLLLQTRVWKYDPDVVLLAFYSGNDVPDNHRALKESNRSAYFVLEDGELVLDPLFEKKRRKMGGPWTRFLDAIYPWSRVAQVANEGRRRLRAGGFVGSSKSRGARSASPPPRSRAAAPATSTSASPASLPGSGAPTCGERPRRIATSCA